LHTSSCNSKSSTRYNTDNPRNIVKFEPATVWPLYPGQNRFAAQLLSTRAIQRLRRTGNAYGRRNDDGIFKESATGKAFDVGRMNIPQPAAIREGGFILSYYLVGDEAFPLKSYLLRPHPERGRLTPEQDTYNYRLSRARRIIENTFDIIASQWRIYIEIYIEYI